jgi:hypothetical protein
MHEEGKEKRISQPKVSMGTLRCGPSLIPRRNILSEIGRKHGQYMDFAQQDAHKFLVQLLDAMRMEELDVSTRLVFLLRPFCNLPYRSSNNDSLLAERGHVNVLRMEGWHLLQTAWV